MKVIETNLPGVLILEPTVHGDDRGFFLETFHAGRYAAHGIATDFVQDNHSKSGHGILRGLHTQLGDDAQGKLLRVIDGSIFDVAVDIRVGSPTFGHHVTVEISAENFRQLWVPPNFAHGFCVTSESAQVEYKCTRPYAPESELSILWNDPAIGIPWPIDHPTLSKKDQDAPTLEEAHDQLPRYQ